MSTSRRNQRKPSHIVGFSIELRSRGFSKTTQDNYRREIERFSEHLGRPLEEAVRVDLSAYISERMEQSANRADLAHKALRCFYKYLSEELEIPDPSARLTKPKVPEPVTHYVTEDQYEELQIAAGPRPHAGPFEKAVAVRDRALLAVMWDTGARLGEIVGMKLDHVDFESDPAAILIPKSKTGRPRTVFMRSRTAKYLVNYLRQRELFEGAESDALWLGKKGPLTDHGVKMLIKRVADDAGIKVSPHMFRRGFRVHAGMDGMDPTAIMTIAGWKSTAMLDRYARPGAEALAASEWKRVKR